jgi:DNA-binding CsgD family transcriptional regulator/tetratricopeptide (TPR) repeat protein
MAYQGSSPVLVGRDAQLAALTEALERTAGGGQRAVLISGEAGAGKSRLVTEFAATAAGTRVLTGSCLQLGADGLPFAPFAEVLRDLVREFGAAAVAAMVPGSGARELARLLPELGEPDYGRDPGEALARLFEELFSLLESLAARGPVILIIEDAHWADQSSRKLLTSLIGHQRALPGVMIAVTLRSDEMHRTHPLRPLLTELARIDWVERIELPRLTRRETGELAARILGYEPDADLAAALFERSEGNPLFAEELLHSPGLGRDLPESLRDLLLAATARLPAQTQEVLRVASAGIEPNGHAILSAVTGLPDDELASVLRPAVTANVLLASRDGYSFRHFLIGEAVYDDLLPGEGERLHARYAAALDADPSLADHNRRLMEVAHHWYWARNAPAALASAWRAAADARQSVAYAERLALLGRVLELWDQVPDAAERIGTDRPGVLEEAARTAYPAGDNQRGLAFANAALKELDPATEPTRAALMLYERSRFKRHLGLPGSSEDLFAALPLVPAAGSAPARALILLALARFADKGEAATREMAEEALALARQAGDARTEASAMVTLAMVDAGPGNLALPGSGALARIAGIRSLAGRIGAHELLVHAAINESHLLEGAGEHERAAEVARKGIADAESYGLARASGTFIANNVAEPLLGLGHWDEAIEVAERALELSPPPLFAGALRIKLGRIAVARGDLEAASGFLAGARHALAEAPYQDQYHLPLARLEMEVRLAADGPASGVETAAAALSRFDLPHASPRYAWPLLVVAAGAGLAALRSGPAARDESLRAAADALLGRAQATAPKLEAFGPVQRAFRLSFGAQERLWPLLRATTGQARGAGSARIPASGSGADAARDAWDAAAAAWDALHEPYPMAIALACAAEAALADADRDAAATRLRDAARLAGQLGARPLSEEIAALARRARIVLGDGAPAAAGPDRLGLTDREFEVLRLVAAGQSNREIAGGLFISAKTASVHVSNILAKLGVASRGEAAARAHSLRLFDTPPDSAD